MPAYTSRAQASLRWVSALLCMLLGIINAPEAGAQCRPLDQNGQVLLEWARRIAASGDSTDAATRVALGIPQANSNQVSYVSDSKLCQQAVVAYAAAAGTPTTGRSIHLVKVGSIYIIQDPTVQIGEWMLTITADRKFNFLAKFTG